MLYVERCAIKNTASISLVDIDFPFGPDGKPKPLILVGENGTGKTTAISFIADALFSFAATTQDDVLKEEGLGRLKFRLRIIENKIGALGGFAYLRFKSHIGTLEYFDHQDEVVDQSTQDFLRTTSEFNLLARASEKKLISNNIEKIIPEIREGIYCFFPSGRKETPHWLQSEAIYNRPTNRISFSNKLQKPIIIDSATSDAITWVMDGLLDKSAGYEVNDFIIANELIKIILDDPSAHFAIAPRAHYPRVQIFGVVDGERTPLVPSLSHLSAGQSMLFSMFATLASHGSRIKQCPLADMCGIVVIDEIEMYLHTKFQRTILPKLISMFPNVQFIITSHSPAFLFGMQEKFGKEGVEVRDMPSGSIIDIEQFSEIAEAMDAISQSKVFNEKIRCEVAAHNEMPILFVEGKSDVIFIEALWKLWTNEAPNFQIRSANSKRALRYLLEDDEFISNVGENQRVLGIFDFDEAYDDWNGLSRNYPHQAGSDATGLTKRNAKKWIFAGLLPIPEIRSLQAGEKYRSNSRFTIELYFPDSDLETGDNLAKTIAPGDVQISTFKGDKVGFANRVTQDKLILRHFMPLLEMIKRTLDI